MSNLISSVDVANTLNKWYLHIKKREVSQAVELRDDIQEMLGEMEENQDVLLYFNILDYRFKVLMEDLVGQPTITESERVKTDDMLRFYFYLFKGMYESAKNNYSEALVLFRVAERQLDKVHDEIEKAEFHYKIGTLYYFNKVTLLSHHHLQTAKDIYKGHEGYSIQTINCNMLLALNLIDDGRLDKAERMLLDCVDRLIEKNDKRLLALAYYDLGFLKIQDDHHIEAIEYFNKAISADDLKQSAPVSYLQCAYEFARSSYKSNQLDQAISWVAEGKSFSKEQQNTNFILKFNILEKCYTTPRESYEDIKKGLCLLEERKAYVDIEALAPDVASIYKKLNLYEESNYFLELALKSCTLIGKEVI
ncbi:tetratricopeptide repeat protein [Bacillus safensis]|uniref:Rap family tetratricopeptide repeat protein n=1 Tax=Bacillus TaxID=1386 RepID=UPI0008779402|nr:MULTISPECIES: Rap family tetratricopeptide repeat protein [Bacillus]MBK4211708.1 tetratricopeptide repeat protein [Bacillus pumilus]MBT2259990.1 tetratricopeptide repeat protein [Bacillus safensis]MDH6562410.1 response regulator aspartate phosphatase D [Bacillus sp. TBS-096]MEC2426336.1 tetratricopeptide repeat protein [Bacillus safensis]